MTEDDFWRQIAARPFELDPKLVFADFLAEQGDPRAEAIMFANRASLTGAEKRRLKQLERDHAASWFGPLSAIAARTSSTFSFGLLDTLEIAFHVSAQRLSELLDEPRLSTVRSLDSAVIASATAMKPFLQQRSVAGLRRLILAPDALPALREGTFPFQLEALGVSNAEAFEDVFVELSRLPLARAVPTWEFISKLLFGTNQANELFDAVLRQARVLVERPELRLTVPYGVFEGVGTWLTRPASHAQALAGCARWSVHSPGLHFTLHREDAGHWPRLTVRLVAETMRELDDRVSRLAAHMVLLGPAVLDRIEVSSGLNLTRAHQHALKVALRRLPTASLELLERPT